MVSRVRAIAESNIGVMGHIGLTPQSATKLGGFKAQGRTADAAKRLYEDALALQDGGRVRDRARGGAGAGRGARSPRRSTCRRSASARARTATGRCSSGTTCSACTRATRRASSSATRRSPTEIGDAVAQYAADVRSGAFPEEQHTYGDLAEELAASRPRSKRRVSAAQSRPATGATHGERARRRGARPRPAVDGAHADPRAGRPPRRRRRDLSAVKTCAPAPASLPPLRKTSSP